MRLTGRDWIICVRHWKGSVLLHRRSRDHWYQGAMIHTSRCVRCRLLYWSDFRDDERAGIYVFSLDDATKSRLLPNSQIRPRALAVDFAGVFNWCSSYGYATDQFSVVFCLLLVLFWTKYDDDTDFMYYLCYTILLLKYPHTMYGLLC